MVTRTKDNKGKAKILKDFVTTRYTLPKGLLADLSTPAVEPTCYSQACKDPKWCAAMIEEFNALIHNDTSSSYGQCKCGGLQVGLSHQTKGRWLD